MTTYFSHLPFSPTLEYTWEECLDILHLEAPSPGTDIRFWKQDVLLTAYRHFITAPECDPRTRRAFEILNFYYQGPPKPPAPVPAPKPPGVVYKVVNGSKYLDGVLQELSQESPKPGDGKALWFRFTMGPSVVKIKGASGARRFIRVLEKNNMDYLLELV